MLASVRLAAALFAAVAVGAAAQGYNPNKARTRARGAAGTHARTLARTHARSLAPPPPPPPTTTPLSAAHRRGAALPHLPRSSPS